MEPEITGKKYDKVASWWHNRHKNSNYGMVQIEKAIQFCKIKKKALDVGCGAGGRIIRKLLENGFDVTGIDISEKMLEIAKSEHPNLKFEHTDICEWTSTDKFDFIVAWDSIFHLPVEKQEPVIRNLCQCLNKDGVLIYTFGDVIGNHEDYSFMDDSGNQYGELENDIFGYGSIGISENLRVINDAQCKCMHLELDQYPEVHVYVILKKE